MSKLWKKSTRGTGVSGKIRLVSISKCGLFGMRGGYLFQFKLWQAFHQHSPNANLSKVCHSHKNMTWLSTCNKCSQKGSFGFVPKGMLLGVSTDLVRTRKGYYRKCSYKPSGNNIPTKLVVEGFPQA